MLSGRQKIRDFPWLKYLMFSASKITLCEMCVLFQVAVIYIEMLCKFVIKELRSNCF